MTRAFLLIGESGSSLSPAMHNAAFAALGLTARYELLRAARVDAELLATLRRPEVWGANVTIPHKLAVLPFLDALTEGAQAIGAVNTIVNRSGALTGHNTDAPGFLRALREDAGFGPARERAVLLGAGGAARAVALALLQAGSQLEVYNRTPAKAEALAEAFCAHGDIRALTEAELPGAVARAALLVNTTSAGSEAQPDALPLPRGLLPRALVCDIIYRPARTRLLREAEAAGLATQNGLPMLLHQGAEAFSLWTGREAPLEVMRGALSGALA